MGTTLHSHRCRIRESTEWRRQIRKFLRVAPNQVETRQLRWNPGQTILLRSILLWRSQCRISRRVPRYRPLLRVCSVRREHQSWHYDFGNYRRRLNTKNIVPTSVKSLGEGHFWYKNLQFPTSVMR